MGGPALQVNVLLELLNLPREVERPELGPCSGTYGMDDKGLFNLFWSLEHVAIFNMSLYMYIQTSSHT